MWKLSDMEILIDRNAVHASLPWCQDSEPLERLMHQHRALCSRIGAFCEADSVEFLPLPTGEIYRIKKDGRVLTLVARSGPREPAWIDIENKRDEDTDATTQVQKDKQETTSTEVDPA